MEKDISPNSGFSLIELVIVIAVLAILSAVAIPSFIGVRNSAKVSAVKKSLVNILKECLVAESNLLIDPTFNAFATPGGYVYFYRGLLAHFNSEAELSGVLSHEIAHITARHAVRGMSTAQITNLLLGILQSNVPGGQLTSNALIEVVIDVGSTIVKNS